MAKKGMFGEGLIVLGVLISYGLDFFIIQQEIFSLRPDYKDMILGCVLVIPLAVYGVVYGLWYIWCATRKTRSYAVYKNERVWMIFTVLFEISLLTGIFMMRGILSEGAVYAGIAFVVPTIAFCIAFLCCRAF